MPQYRRRRKYNPLKKRVKVYGGAAVQLYKDVRYIKGLINSEPHNFTVDSANNFSSAGAIVSLCNIPQGDSVNTRTGNRILPRYLSLHVHMGGATALMAATSGTKVLMRMMLVRSWVDNATAAGNLTVAEVLQTTLSQFAPFSPLNDGIVGSKRDRNRRIEVLRSEIVAVDNTGSTQFSHVFNYNITMNGGNTKEHIDYVSGSTGEPNSGGIYIIFIQDSLTSTYAQYTFTSKLNYYDN